MEKARFPLYSVVDKERKDCEDDDATFPVVEETLEAIKKKNFRERCNVVSEVDGFPAKAYHVSTWTESAKTLADLGLFVTQSKWAKAMCA